MISITRFVHFLPFPVIELPFCCFTATFYYEFYAFFHFSRNISLLKEL